MRAYNRALSDSEVKALYDYESVPQPQLPRAAIATAQIINGFLVGATVTNGGFGYSTNPLVIVSGGGGSGARAIANVVNGVVTTITILQTGTGYTSTPTLTIAAPPSPPRRSTATGEIINGFVVDLTLTDGGSGYDVPPTILLAGGGGSGAAATANVINRIVVGITVINPGHQRGSRDEGVFGTEIPTRGDDGPENVESRRRCICGSG